MEFRELLSRMAATVAGPVAIFTVTGVAWVALATDGGTAYAPPVDVIVQQAGPNRISPTVYWGDLPSDSGASPTHTSYIT